MALTLDSALQTAQDGVEHHPIVQLLSMKTVADIPFTGNVFTSDTKEMKPKFLVHSSGRIIGFNLEYADSTTNHLYMFYTDVDRIEFTIDIPLITNTDIDDFALVELVNGDIGVCYIRKNGANYDIRAFGVNVSGAITISDYLIISNSYVKYSITVIRLANDTYTMVYNNYTSGTPAWNVFVRTSSNFTSWSSVVDIISSFGLSPSNTIDNRASTFFLLETAAESELLLFFYFVDGLDTNLNPLRNIYYSKSTDNGATWGTTVKVTNYTDFTKIGYYPSAVQTDADSMYLAFTEESGALFIGESTTGWPPQQGGDSGYDFVSYIMLDSVNQKLYAVVAESGYVYTHLQGIFEIDIATWTITKTRNYITTPAVPAVIQYVSSRYDECYKRAMVGNKVIVGTLPHICVWEAETDVMRSFNFTTHTATETAQNVVGWPSNRAFAEAYHEYDEVNNHVWIMAYGRMSGGTSGYSVVGYLDLNDTGPEYTFNVSADFYTMSDVFGSNLLQRRIYGNEYWFSQIDGIEGDAALRCWDLAAGAESFRLNANPDGGLPRNSLGDFVLHNNKIYGIFTYYASSGYDTQKGLCIIDVASSYVHFAIPPYKTANDYGFNSLTLVPELDEILIGTSSDGVVIFNTLTETFDRKSNDEIPGITPNNTDNLWWALYDQANDRYFAASYSYLGITTFLRDGKFKQTMYKIGAKDTDWEFSTSAKLINGISDFNAWVGIDEDNKVWAFWQKDKSNNTKYYLAWDSIEPQFDVTEYLVDSISRKVAVDGSPHELQFKLSHGYLFDPSNLLSLFNKYVKKGRKLVFKAGEKVSGVDYWAAQGTFYVTETALSFRISQYPTISITAQDIRTFWDDDEQVVVSYQGQYPEAILADLVENLGGIASGDITINFTGPNLIDAQWADTKLSDMIPIICNRYGHFSTMTTDDKFITRKIAIDNSVNHTYTDKKAMIGYSPDDSYSDMVNRVTVTGEEQDDIEILFPEERVASLSGTAGWWGMKKDFDVYYSEDRSRRCRYPRLEVLESASGMGFFLAGEVDESISEVDSFEKFCTVTVDVPNLIPQLTAAIATYFAGNKIGDIVDPATGKLTYPWGRYIEGTGLYIALTILGSMCNFQYEIWAQPLGYARRSVEYTANDEEFQIEIGKIIAEKVEGFACYTVGDCRVFAEFLIMLKKLQRKRVQLEKIAHFQDEEGDTIQIPHPYSGQVMKIFISEIERTWELGKEPKVIDKIEGWRI